MGVFQDASLDVAVGIGVRDPGEFFDGRMESCRRTWCRIGGRVAGRDYFSGPGDCALACP